LRPGGRLLYVTCTTEPQENEEVVQAFLLAHPEFHLAPGATRLPPAARSLVQPKDSSAPFRKPITWMAFSRHCSCEIRPELALSFLSPINLPLFPRLRYILKSPKVLLRHGKLGAWHSRGRLSQN